MWDWLKNADNLKAVGTLGSAIATGYSAYESSKAAKDVLSTQKAAYNRGIAREDASDSAFDEAINTNFVKKEEKKEPAMEIGA